MFSILYDEYKKHKKFVRFYLGLCIVLAFTVGAYSPNISTIASDSATVSTEDTLLQLNDRVAGKAFKEMAGDYSDIVSISAEPFAALLFLGVVQDVNKLLDNPLNMTELPIGQPAILVVIALCFIASKIMKSNATTRVFGLCTLGTLEKYLGTVCVLGVALVSVVGLASGTASSVVSAAELNGTVAAGQTSNVLTGFLASIFSAFMGFMSLIVNYIVKTVIRGIEAIATLFSGIPFISLVCETAKTGLVFFLFAITKLWPVGGYIVNILVFIMCCIIFKACYNAAKYFEQIYFVPFVKKIFKANDPMPMIPKHVPGYLKKALEQSNISPDFIIPVYVTGKHRGCPLQFKRFERLWFVNQGGCNYLYIRKHKKEEARFVYLNSSPADYVYLFKKRRYFEIFTYWNTPENKAKKYPKKAFTIVFAKSYEPTINDLMRRMGYVDMVEMKATTKAEKKAAKKAKREETWEEFKNMMNSFFHGNKINA